MKRSFILVAIAAIFAVFPSFAKEGGDAIPPKDSFVSQHITDKLKLTPEQNAKLKELRVEFAKKQDEWLAAHKPNRGELRKEIEAAEKAKDTAKQKELEAKWDEQFKALHQIRLEYRDKLREVLTDEQKTTFNKSLEEAKKRWAERQKSRRLHDEDDDDAPPALTEKK